MNDALYLRRVAHRPFQLAGVRLDRNNIGFDAVGPGASGRHVVAHIGHSFFRCGNAPPRRGSGCVSPVIAGPDAARATGVSLFLYAGGKGSRGDTPADAEVARGPGHAVSASPNSEC